MLVQGPSDETSARDSVERQQEDAELASFMPASVCQTKRCGLALPLVLGIGIPVVVGTLIVATLIHPSAEVWTKAQHLRQVLGLGAAGLVLAVVAGSIERRSPAALERKNVSEVSSGELRQS